jgi:hypothetical protein
MKMKFTILFVVLSLSSTLFAQMVERQGDGSGGGGMRLTPDALQKTEGRFQISGATSFGVRGNQTKGVLEYYDGDENVQALGLVVKEENESPSLFRMEEGDLVGGDPQVVKAALAERAKIDVIVEKYLSSAMAILGDMKISDIGGVALQEAHSRPVGGEVVVPIELIINLQQASQEATLSDYPEVLKAFEHFLRTDRTFNVVLLGSHPQWERLVEARGTLSFEELDEEINEIINTISKGVEIE